MASRLIDSFGTTDELSEVFSDRSVLGAMLQFESALARAQARLNVIPACAAESIAKAARADSFDAEAFARDARRSATVVIPFVQALAVRVEAFDPGAAAYVHWGATSQDVVDTALALLLVRSRSILERDHTRLEVALRSLSKRHALTVMLSRTLLQPAPPTTFGYKAAGWFGAIHRAWQTLARSFFEGLQLQFGGASGTLAAYGANGPALAAELGRELGLGVPEAPWHTHRDRLAGIVCHCGIYAGCLGKIARDVALLMQQEVGEASEPGGGSSAMPNKRNPASSVVALAAASRVPGLVAAYLSAMSQEHERAAGGSQAEWQTVSDIVQAAGSALAAVAETVEGLSVDPDRMRANLAATGGAVFAEKAALLLAPRLGRAAAQALAARAAAGQPLRDGLEKEPEAAALLTAEQIGMIDRPEDYLGAAEVFRRRLLNEQE